MNTAQGPSWPAQEPRGRSVGGSGRLVRSAAQEARRQFEGLAGTDAEVPSGRKSGVGRKPGGKVRIVAALLPSTRRRSGVGGWTGQPKGGPVVASTEPVATLAVRGYVSRVYELASHPE